MSFQKGITMIGLLMGVLVSIVYFALLPSIQSMITSVLPQTDATTGLFISLFPLLMFVVILIGIMAYGNPQAEQVG
jgi:small-conductance mechanosensitive channel